MKKRKIVDIQIQSRRKNRRTIFLDDGSVFGVSEDVFFTVPIHIGDTISDQALDDILKAESKVKIYDSAVNLLSYRMRSKSELRNRLIRKKYHKGEISDVIKNLEIKGYLDDEKFAIAFAKDKVNNRLIGPIALRFELSAHELEVQLIDKTINSIYNIYPPKDIIKRLINKWKLIDSINESSTVKNKIINRLKNKGFYWDDIQDVIYSLENK